jgi:hypothetical protein
MIKMARLSALIFIAGKMQIAFPVGIGVDKGNNVYVGGSLGFY